VGADGWVGLLDRRRRGIEFGGLGSMRIGRGRIGGIGG